MILWITLTLGSHRNWSITWQATDNSQASPKSHTVSRTWTSLTKTRWQSSPYNKTKIKDWSYISISASMAKRLHAQKHLFPSSLPSVDFNRSTLWAPSRTPLPRQSTRVFSMWLWTRDGRCPQRSSIWEIWLLLSPQLQTTTPKLL